MDPEVFEPASIVSLRPWCYDGRTGRLYDLAVDCVHSFVAAGILVSNSVYVHEDLTAQHTVGKAKYLEDPVRERESMMPDRVVRRIKQKVKK